VPESSPPESVEPLWIAAPEAWRDLCFALPAIRALADTQPVKVLYPQRQQAFWTAEGMPVPSRICRPNDAGIRELVKLLRPCRRILLWDDGPTAAAAAKAKVPERRGLPSRGLAKKLTHPVKYRVRPGPTEHAVRRFLKSAEELGADPYRPGRFEPVSGRHPRDPERLLVCPGSDFGETFQWPVDRWIELLGKFDGAGLKIEISGSDPAARAVAEALGHEPPEDGIERDLSGYGFCLAADGSLPHVAAAFGVTCAVLYGPDDPRRIRPLGKHHRAIRRKAECSPCFAAHCPLDLRCQLELEVDEVAARLAEFF
jgi:ADP-heptose:LPS heptosyltransferase